MDNCSGVTAHLGSLSTLAFRGVFMLFHHTTPKLYHEPQNTVFLLVGHVTRRVQSNAERTEGNTLEQVRVTRKLSHKQVCLDEKQ